MGSLEEENTQFNLMLRAYHIKGWLMFLASIFLMQMPVKLMGQEFSYTRSLGVAVHPGFVFAHTDDARNMQAHSMGFELQLTKFRFENRAWTKGYQKPKVGLNVLYMDLGQPDLTGRVFALIPNFETSFKTSENSDFGIRLGTGLGYLTQSFDRVSNRRNLSIGTHLNGAMQILFLWNRYGEKGRMTGGFGITHFSNASARVPNLGVNMPSLFLGAHLDFKKQTRMPFFKDTTADLPFEAYYAMALNERSLADPHQFVIAHVAALKMKRLTDVRYWHYGADLFFDKTHHFMDFPDESLENLKPREMTEVGVRAGYVWRMSCIDLSTDIGFYLYRPSKNKAFTYQMVGIKYNLNDRLFLQSNLKIHYGTADFFEWGLGYKWNKRA
jgi:hypothetical protein